MIQKGCCEDNQTESGVYEGEDSMEVSIDRKEQEKMRRLEKSPRRKLIAGLILLIVLLGLYAGYLIVSNLTSNMISGMESRLIQMKALSQSIDKAFALRQSVAEDVSKRHLSKVIMEANGCCAKIEAGEELEPCLYQDGAVIRVRDGSVEYPRDFPKEISIDTDQMQEPAGLLISLRDGEGSVLSGVYYARIKDGFYYTEWMPMEQIEDEWNRLFDADKAMAGIEQAFQVKLLMFSETPGVDGQHALLYFSNDLAKDGRMTTEDFGITQEMISSAGYGKTAGFGTETEAGAETENGRSVIHDADGTTEKEAVPLAGYRLLTIDGVDYEVFLQKYKFTAVDEATILACLVPMEVGMMIQGESVLLILAVFFIIGVFLLVWYSATLRLVRDHNLDDRQKKEFSFRAILRRTVSILVIGCLIILLASAMLFALNRLFLVCRQVETAFSTLQQRIEENSYSASLTESTRKKTYEGFAEQLARILENQPDYERPEYLQTVCDLIDADYIMLFDGDGNETISNSRHIGLSLGTDPSSSTYDFRRLLTGTMVITHDLAVDEATGEEHVMIGAGYGKPEEGENYKALLIAVPGERIYDSTPESIDDVMTFLTAGRMTAFSVDPETHLVLHASKPSLVGKNAVDLGLPEKALHAGCRDFFTIDGKPVYVECEEIDSVLYYYTANQADIYSGIWKYSAILTVVAALLLIILAVFLLSGYGKFFAAWSEIGETLRDEEEEIQLSGGRRKHSRDPSMRWKLKIDSHRIHAPFHYARIISTVLLVISVVLLGAGIVVSGTGSEESLLRFIVRGQWTKGVNLFAITSILILFFEVMIVVGAIKILLRLISSALGTKGETICRLLISLANYGGIIFFAYYSLYYLGFQPGTLLASLGLLSFAVSLGAKDLITDIIAGLSIVFEGEYQVGDIIEVGGYRGEVLEIGVRTTKLEGQGGNIKIISNRDIKNVVNMTRLNSWCTLEVSITADATLDQVENLLREQLPHIGESISQIVNGPFYKGVVSMGRGAVTLSIVAECNEGDYYSVQRSLNRAIQELFVEHEIKIL